MWATRLLSNYYTDKFVDIKNNALDGKSFINKKNNRKKPKSKSTSSKKITGVNFIITSTKRYVAVVTLFTLLINDNIKLL